MENGYKTSSSGWDVCRFLRTLAYFGAIPLLSRVGWIQGLLGSDANPVVQNVEDSRIGRSRKRGSMIFDFSDSSHRSSGSLQDVWGSVDDVVMGGISSSRLQAAAGSVVFTGTVSTANSGGFASVRTRNFEPPFDLAGCEGIRVTVKGDGNRYKFLLRDGVQWDGMAYAHSFDTIADEWMTVDVPFEGLVPVVRARIMPEAPQIDAGKIRAFQFMLSKFEYDGGLNPSFQSGSFELYIQSVSSY